jgi:hypothetical protein
MKLREFLKESTGVTYKIIPGFKPKIASLIDNFVPIGEMRYSKIEIHGASSIADIPFADINKDKFFLDQGAGTETYLDLSDTSIKDFRGFPKDSLRSYFDVASSYTRCALRKLERSIF